MNKQLKLSDLKVHSFVTKLKTANSKTAKGGSGTWTNVWCDDGSGYDDTRDSCYYSGCDRYTCQGPNC